MLGGLGHGDNKGGLIERVLQLLGVVLLRPKELSKRMLAVLVKYHEI